MLYALPDPAIFCCVYDAWFCRVVLGGAIRARVTVVTGVRRLGDIPFPNPDPPPVTTTVY
jgi:hypothetical protein